MLPELAMAGKARATVEKHGRWRESFLTVCTLFQTMLTPLDMSYTFLTVCTWFQTKSTPLDTSYTFLTVCTWFQTLSTPLDTSYTFLSVCTWFLEQIFSQVPLLN